MQVSYSAVPPLVGEAIGARAEIGWGASCRRTTLSCRVVFDVIFTLSEYRIVHR